MVRKLWTLLVDTEFLYLEAKKRFGNSARIDYLKLPANVALSLEDITFFNKKIAVVMRHGNDWESFAKSLQRFSYDVIPTDRGLHHRAIMQQAERVSSEGDGLVLVSSLERASQALSACQNELFLFTFFDIGSDVIKFSGERHNIDVKEISPDWLWRKT